MTTRHRFSPSPMLTSPMLTSPIFTSLTLALALIVVAGCETSAPEASLASEAHAASTESPKSLHDAAPGASAPGEAQEAPSAATDRGNARFTTNGTTWQGTYASATLKKEKLTLSASKMERDGDKMKRDSFDMHINDYHGVGHYKTAMMSMFVRVSIDIPKDAKAQANPQETMRDALGSATSISLTNVSIEITSDKDGFIDGTFSIDRPESAITDGHIHAQK